MKKQHACFGLHSLCFCRDMKAWMIWRVSAVSTGRWSLSEVSLIVEGRRVMTRGWWEVIENAVTMLVPHWRTTNAIVNMMRATRAMKKVVLIPIGLAEGVCIKHQVTVALCKTAIPKGLGEWTALKVQAPCWMPTKTKMLISLAKTSRFFTSLCHSLFSFFLFFSFPWPTLLNFRDQLVPIQQPLPSHPTARL